MPAFRPGKYKSVKKLKETAHPGFSTGISRRSADSIRRYRLLARQRALRQILVLLTEAPNVIAPKICALIAQYHFRADELTEAGICYEMVRALETRCPSLLLD
jgi:hypothetical protein